MVKIPGPRVKFHCHLTVSRTPTLARASTRWRFGLMGCICVYLLYPGRFCVYFLYICVKQKKNGVKIISGALLPNIGHGIHDSMISLSNLLTGNRGISPNIFECLKFEFRLQQHSPRVWGSKNCAVFCYHTVLIILSVYRVRWYS